MMAKKRYDATNVSIVYILDENRSSPLPPFAPTERVALSKADLQGDVQRGARWIWGPEARGRTLHSFLYTFSLLSSLMLQQEVMEELGIETDEAAGVSQENDLTSKRLKGK